MHGGGGVPLSLAVMVAAEDWGCPPWEIAGGEKTEWFARWLFWKEQQAKAAAVERKKWEAQSSHAKRR